MAYPTTVISDAPLTTSDKQGTSNPTHRNRHNNLVADLAAVETALGVTAADGSQLGYLRFNDNAGNGVAEEAARDNLALNSQFRVWQRGITTSTDLVYLADRFLTSLGTGGSPAYTITRQAHTLGDLPGEPEFFLRFNQTAQATTTPPTIEQRLESVRRVANGKVTISFWARCSSGTVVVTPRVIQNFGTGGSPSAAVNTDGSTITVTTTWTRYARTIAVPSIAGKTLGSGGNDYLSAMLRFPTSATFQVDISQFKVERGATASAFQPIPLVQDLAACQRFYYKTFPQATTPAQNSGVLTGCLEYISSLGASLTSGAQLRYPVPMRATPTVTYYNPSAANNKWRNLSGSADSGTGTTVRSDQSAVVVLNTQVGTDATQNEMAIHLTADAEL